MSLPFLLTAFLVAASPGTGVLVTLAAGLSNGRRSALLAAFGCTLGIVPHMATAMTGLAAILHASALAFETIRYAGVAYLLAMAWSVLKESGQLRLDPGASPKTAGETILSAILVNILNPKLSIFFLAFLPQFVERDEAHPILAMGELSLVFMAITFGVFALYGIFAASARRRILARPRILAFMRRAFAAAFLGLGLKLAFAER